MKKSFFFLALFSSLFFYQTSLAAHNLIIDTTQTTKLSANGAIVTSYLLSHKNEKLETKNPRFYFRGGEIKKILVIREASISSLSLPKFEFCQLNKLLTKGIHNLVPNPEKTTIDCFLSLAFLKNISCHYMDCDGAPFFLVDKIFSSEQVVTEESLKPGDGIKISQPSSGSYHCAFYLGQDLYFSKYGEKAGFVVTTLKEMKKFWGHGDPSGFFLYKIDRAEEEASAPQGANIRKVSKETYFKKLCRKHPDPFKFWEIIKRLYPVSPDFKAFVEKKLELRVSEPSLPPK